MRSESWYVKYKAALAAAERRKFLITFDDPDPSEAPDYDAPRKSLEAAGHEVFAFGDGPETTLVCSCSKGTTIEDLQAALESLFQNKEGTVIVAEIGTAYLWPEADTSPRDWRQIGN